MFVNDADYLIQGSDPSTLIFISFLKKLGNMLAVLISEISFVEKKCNLA